VPLFFIILLPELHCHEYDSDYTRGVGLANGFIARLYSAVGITTGYGLDDRGVGVRVPEGSRISYSPRRPDQL
jgi:hypothetical protein